MNDQPDTPKSPSIKKFFDITPPGQTVPSATSRPVIVSNKPEQADQMIQPPTTPPQPLAQPALDTPVSYQPADSSSLNKLNQAAAELAESTSQETADLGVVPTPEAPGVATPLGNPGITTPPETVEPAGFSAEPAVSAVQPLAPAAGNSANFGDEMSSSVSPDTSNQVFMNHDRNLLKALFWLALLIFAVGLLIFTLIKWSSL